MLPVVSRLSSRITQVPSAVSLLQSIHSPQIPSRNTPACLTSYSFCCGDGLYRIPLHSAQGNDIRSKKSWCGMGEIILFCRLSSAPNLFTSPFSYLTKNLMPELADCDAMFHLWSHGVNNGSLRLFLTNYHWSTLCNYVEQLSIN